MAEHTGALIVATPAVTDWVNKICTEDSAHITMAWFGEAAEIPEELIQAARECVQAAVTTTPNLIVKVSGLAVLGEDKASVLLLESAELTALHELLVNAPPVAAAMANAEQFPNWTPHLTLGYPDTVDHAKLSLDDLPSEITIDGLGLWLGGEKEEFPLVGDLHIEKEDTINDDTEQEGFFYQSPSGFNLADAAEAAKVAIVKVGSLSESFQQISDSFDMTSAAAVAMTAALKKPHDPSLHPRGPDGRFIKKFGVVKYLGKDNKWKYGSVDRVFEDDNGKTMVGLTPSDLGGKPLPGAAEFEISPKKLYSAPKKKAHLTTKSPGVQQVGGKAGSNEGGLFEIPKKAPGPSGVKKVTPAEALQLIDKVTGTDEQSEYIRRALSAKKDFGDDDADVYAKIGADGIPLGALALIKRPDEGANVIDYVGAKGVGRELVTEAAKDTQAQGLTLLAEPTANSIDYWKGLGFKEDPDGMGTPFYGLSGDDLAHFIAGENASTKFYVKKPKTKKHGQNEELANDLYAAVGVRVPNVDTGADGMTYSEIVPGKHDAKARIAAGDKEWMRKVQNDFVVDAWLANWDVMGMGWDNILTTEDGTPVRIDNGGAVLYRAMGNEKGTAFGANVGELEQMRTGKKAAIYGKDVMPLEAELDGAQRILALSPTDIEDMVSKVGLPKSTADTLKARRKFIADHYKLPLPESMQAADTTNKIPLVDAPDLSKGHGKSRDWQEMPFSLAKGLLKDGDEIYFINTGDHAVVDGSIDDNGMPKLDYEVPAKYKNADGPVMVKQDNFWAKKPRPTNGAKVPGEDLVGYHWQRGDRVKDGWGIEFEVLGAAAYSNGETGDKKKWTGKLLVKSTYSGIPSYLNTNGKEYEIVTWDAPKTAAVYSEIITPDTTSLPSKPKAGPPAKVKKLSQPIANAEMEKLGLQKMPSGYSPTNTGYQVSPYKAKAGNGIGINYKGTDAEDQKVAVAKIKDHFEGLGYDVTTGQAYPSVILRDPNSNYVKQKKAFQEASQKKADFPQTPKDIAPTKDPKALDPKDQGKIDSAENMFGTNSPEYKTAVEKWGTPLESDAPEPLEESQPTPAAPTGMAVPASQAIQADIIPPGQVATEEEKAKVTLETLPADHGILSDLTVAKPGDSVFSKKDGKTYTFVSGKDNYGVVTDPNSANPDKKIAKSLAVLSQPGVTPTAEPVVPKTKDGKVPAIGMTVVMANNENGVIDKISKNGNIVYVKTSDGKVKPKTAIQVESYTPKATDPNVLPFFVAEGFDGKGQHLVQLDVSGPGVPEGTPPVTYAETPDGNWVDVTDGYPISAHDMEDMKKNGPFQEWKSPTYVEPTAKDESGVIPSAYSPSDDEKIIHLNDGSWMTSFDNGQSWQQIKPDGSLSKMYWSDQDFDPKDYTVVQEGTGGDTLSGDNTGDAKMLSDMPTLSAGDKISNTGGDSWYEVTGYSDDGNTIYVSDGTTNKYMYKVHSKFGDLWLVDKKKEDAPGKVSATSEPPFDVPEGYDTDGKHLIQIDHPSGAFVIEINDSGGGVNMKGASYSAADIEYFKNEYPTTEWKSPFVKSNNSTGIADLKIGHTFQLSSDDGEHEYIVIAPPDKSNPPNVMVMVDGDPDDIKVMKGGSLPPTIEVTQSSIVSPNIMKAGEIWAAHNNVPFGAPDSTLVGKTEAPAAGPKAGDKMVSKNGFIYELLWEHENGNWAVQNANGAETDFTPDQMANLKPLGGEESTAPPSIEVGDTLTDQAGFTYQIREKDEDGIWIAEGFSPDGESIGTTNLSPSMAKNMEVQKGGAAAPTTAPEEFNGYTAKPTDSVIKIKSQDTGIEHYWVKQESDTSPQPWKKIADGKPSTVSTSDQAMASVLEFEDVESEVVYGSPSLEGPTPPPTVDAPTILSMDQLSIDPNHPVFQDPYSGLYKPADIAAGGWKPHAYAQIQALGTLQPGQKLWYVPTAEQVYLTSNTGGSYGDLLYQVMPDGTLAPDPYTDQQYMSDFMVPIDIGVPSAPTVVTPAPPTGIATTLTVKIPGTTDHPTTPTGYQLFPGQKVRKVEDSNGNALWFAETSADVWTMVLPDGSGLGAQYASYELQGMGNVTEYTNPDAPAAPFATPTLTAKIPGTSDHPATPTGYQLHPGQNVRQVVDENGTTTWFVETKPQSNDWKMVTPDGYLGNFFYSESEFDSMGTVTDYKVPGGTPTPTAAAPTPAAPAAVPLPTSSAIASWGKPLTKTGHIPSIGMKVVDAKGESQTIVGFNKNENYVIVKGPDGKNKNRSIKTLKTVSDTAGASPVSAPAYVPPVSVGPAPKGMPIAADPPDVAFEKTLKDGKWRPILSGSGGLRGGEMFVSSVKTPSGKKVVRVNFTLTKEQRTKFLENLKNQTLVQEVVAPAGTPPVKLGAWTPMSKQSHNVKIGDSIPMRVATSSTMPDGSPKWKVNTENNHVKPTHKVVKVTDGVGGEGQTIKIVTMQDIDTGEEIVSHFHPNKTLPYYMWDPNKVPEAPKPPPSYGHGGTDGTIELGDGAKAAGWKVVTDGGVMGINGGHNGTLKVEPGQGGAHNAAIGWTTHGKSLRKVGSNGVVIEMITPAKISNDSASGATVITIPEGMDSTALNNALAELGIPYTPVTKDNAKLAVLPMLKQLLNSDVKKAHNAGGMPPADIDSMHGWSEQKIMKKAADTLGIPDLGWQDILIATDESNGKVSYFWSARVQDKIEASTQWKSILREISTVNKDTVKSQLMFGAANGVMQKRIGGLHGGGGDSAPSDTMNMAGNGSFSSAYGGVNLPNNNPLYGGNANMMAYVHPMSVLGRIQDYRPGAPQSDAFGSGSGKGSNSLHVAMTQKQASDFYLGGGIPAEDLQFLLINNQSQRNQIIKELKAQGYQHPSGKSLEELILGPNDAYGMKYTKLKRPPYYPPNAKPITDLPVEYTEEAEIASAAA